MSIQPQIVQVSHVQRHQSLKSRRHSSSIKKRRSNAIIHITLRSPSHNICSKNNKSFNSNNNSSISLAEYGIKNSFIKQNSIVKPINTTNLSARQNAWETRDLDVYSTYKQNCINNYQSINSATSLNVKGNQIGSTQDYHRKKKKKTSKKCRCIFLCVCLFVALLAIAIAITLGILLSKKPTTTVTPSIVASLRWNSSGITIAGTAGISGANSTLLHWPYGIAFDSSNTLYIADYVNNRIQKLQTDTSICVTVAGNTNGLTGTAMDRLNFPVDILFDSNDNMYITDRGNNRIQFWSKGATSGVTVAGTSGSSNISLYGPSSIVYGSNSDTIYISDTFNHRIVNYPPGNIVAGGNGPGNNATQLNYPYGLVYDSVSNSFVIPNYSTNNIVQWILGDTLRTHVVGDVNGASGLTSTFLNAPVGLTMDPMGNIYVADSNNHRIQFFLANQSNATTITGTTGLSGTNSTQLNTPFWVILDNQLNLYVSDTFNNRIQKFIRY